jgi:hypothetical protein
MQRYGDFQKLKNDHIIVNWNLPIIEQAGIYEKGSS